ncbi:MAG: hypothetical protein QOJ94_3239 [Sphingomonadales bacterium]|jgi:hypothetical protein|nr:hypothetical protein [Sphingomonadales bacterium]
MRGLALLLPLTLVACQKPAPPAAKEPEPRSVEPAPPPRTQAGDDAAKTLRRYYDLIEATRYDDAYALRSGGGADRERFAANFRAYENYSAQAGAPSQPVAQGDFEFVDVPVMITGRFVGGKPFGSVGSVTLRRARTGADRSWRIYTG